MKKDEWDTPQGQARRIVTIFARLATEAHRSLIEAQARLTPEQFESIVRDARLLGADNGLRITPLVERLGWWTGYPTRRLAAKATLAAIQRNKGEAHNNAKVYYGFGSITEWNAHDAQQQGYREASFRAAHPELEIAPESDYVLTRVDEAIERDLLYVQLQGGQAA